MTGRTNPFQELERIFDRLSRQFDETTHGFLFDEPFGEFEVDRSLMAVDVIEHDDEFEVTVDLPGFDRDKIDISVSNHTLRINAEVTEEIEEEDKDYIRQERRAKSMHRSIQLPIEIDHEEVSAHMKHGVLTITLPKVEPEEAVEIEIQTE